MPAHAATTAMTPSAHLILVLLVQVAGLLVVARALGALAQRCQMPAILGELLTGLLLGPSLLGHVSPMMERWLFPSSGSGFEPLSAVNQVGVLLLVGIAGCHVDLNMIRRHRTATIHVSVLALVVPLCCGAAIGFVLPKQFLGDDTPRTLFAAFVGVALSVSALPVIAKVLADLHLLHRDFGQLTLAAGMADDALGWFCLSLVSAAAATGLTASGVGRAAASLLGFVLIAATVGSRLIRTCLRRAARAPDQGAAVATASIAILSAAALTQGLQGEPAFGAFVAGIVLGTAPPAELARLAPLRTFVLSVLAPLYLATAGLRVDLAALARPTTAAMAALVLAVAVLAKFGGAYVGARISGLDSWTGLAIGAGMNARGVVEVIIASTGLRLGVLNTASYTVVLLIALTTSAIAPPLLRLAASRLAPTRQELERLDLQSLMSGAQAPARSKAFTVL